jgi:hypothetical protein
LRGVWMDESTSRRGRAPATIVNDPADGWYLIDGAGLVNGSLEHIPLVWGKDDSSVIRDSGAWFQRWAFRN